ncbi:MAG: hypothetical protein M1530_01505, partial [Candidatus Marsarchaeota archaeon]|nr:hypothetical protein [Candidatus Marsarchaeota archaeon]
MIGKAEWFCPRRFGWGLGVKKWEGIAYIIVIIAAVLAVWHLPIGEGYRTILSTVVIGIVALDFLDIMNKVYSELDEREQKHQLVAERNAGLIAVAGLIAYGLYLGFTLPPSQLEAQLFPLIGIGLAIALPAAPAPATTTLALSLFFPTSL